MARGRAPGSDPETRRRRRVRGGVPVVWHRGGRRPAPDCRLARRRLHLASERQRRLVHRQRGIRGRHRLRRVSHAGPAAAAESRSRPRLGDHAGRRRHADRRRRAYRTHLERRRQLPFRRRPGHRARREVVVHLRTSRPAPAVDARLYLLSRVADNRDLDACHQQRRRRHVGHGSRRLADDDARRPCAVARRPARRLCRRRRRRRRVRGRGPRPRSGRADRARYPMAARRRRSCRCCS